MSDIDRDLAEARQALSDEDLHGTLAWIELHLHGLQTLTPGDAEAVLTLYAPVLEAWTGEDAAALARAAAAMPDDDHALYTLAVALVGAGELLPALGVLARARDVLGLRTRFGAASKADLEAIARVAHEACAAEELLGRYAASAAWIEAAPPEVRAMPLSRYLHAFARLMDRDARPAQDAVAALLAADDPAFAFMGERLRAMLARHEALAPLLAGATAPGPVTRIWHAVTAGELLIDAVGPGGPGGTVDPSAPAPSAVRETLDSVAARLRRLGLALNAAGRAPQAVTAPDDRDSHILGLAAAGLLGLPFVPSGAAGELAALDVLVTVWDVAALPEATRSPLKAATPGHLLYVHAGRVEEELPLAADFIGVGIPGPMTGRGPLRVPWGHDGEVFALAGEPTPPRDLRPLTEIAAEVVAASPPLATDDDLATCAARLAAAPEWARPAGMGAHPRPRSRRWRRPVTP